MLRGMRRNNTGQIKTARQMSPKPILFFIATAFILLLFTGISHAADYYVSPTGAATWANCSGSTPLNGTSACSWQTAMANAVAGDIVYFRGGTYNPGDAPADGYTPAMNPTNSGTAGNPIVFKAYPWETPIIVDGSGPVFGAEKRSYITWDGFQSTMSENTQVGKIIEIDYSDNIIIQNCDLRGIPSLDSYNKSGIQIDWSNHVYIYNNKFSAFNGSNVNTGAVWNMSSSYVYFYNNDVYDSEKGFMTKFFPNYVYVYNNYFYNTKIAYYHLPSLGVSPGVDYFVYQNIVNSGSLVYSPDASGVNTNLNIYNNTVYNNTNGAIQIGNNIYHNTRNSKIYNNIIYTVTGTPAFLMYNSTEDRPDYSDYNLFYGNGNWRWDYFTTINSLALWRTTTGFDLNSITSNPLFVNVGGASPADYKLQSNSPARTSGRGGSYATVMGAYITGNEIIGYTGGGSSGNTPPPSGGSNQNTGGEASGGSGCGFVKDDGKGQKTKGEGVVLIMMLIISVTVISVLRKVTRKIKAISMIIKASILTIFMAVLLLPGVSLAANYYIDYQSGSDANSGTSKSSPWQRAPGMAGFSGVYTHQAGDKFIFKGGTTWPSATFPLTIGYSGDAAASDEYTVDKTWYAGSNWTRPVFDGENLTQKFITASNRHYIIIDNIEFTKSDTDYTDSYGNMPYPLYLTLISHWEIKNNYFHDLNTQYSGTSYDNGGYTIYIQASGGFISIHDNRAERVYMHRFAVVGPSSDFSTFEFYNNTVSDVAVGLVFGANNAYTFDNIQIHDNDFSKPYMPYADHSLDGSLTQLNGAIDASQTTINVVNGAVFTSEYNFVIQIGSEYIYVPAGGKTGNTLNNVTRGYAGSTAQAHGNLDSVGLTCSDPWHGDYIHIYQIGSGSITNAKIYNNYFHPGYSGPMPPYPCNSSTWDGGMTAYLYLENHLASPLIYNNIFEGDDEGISMQFSIRNATNPLVMNNTFIGSNKKIGMGIADASINAVVKNNIFSNVKYGITVSADSLSGFTSDNNNFYGLNAVGQFGSLQCTGNSTFCSSLSDWQNVLGGCLNAGNDCGSSTDNPLLDSNYRLTSSSPLTVRDAGAALSSYFSADKDGVFRPQGSAWDIGAYEYCSSGNCSGGGNTTPPPPSSGSGGDSSSSGGSGCGFVKDDGKGQGAKGEGVSLIIMLIIALTGISLARRTKRRA